MALSIMGREMRVTMMRTLLAAAAIALTTGQAAAQAPAPTPNPQLAVAQQRFEALPEAERRAIQTDLIWTGFFNGAASGSYGPLTFRAINALKAGKGAPDGVLAPAEREALGRAAKAMRDAAGFKVLDDERTGVRIGIPERVLPKREVTPSGGSRWQSVDSRITLDATASPPGEDLAASFEKAIAVNPRAPRKITYKLLRPDFFVVTGETATGKFYRRLAGGPQGTRGFSIGYDKALAGSIDKLVIAIASSFEPFPTGPAPSSAPMAVAGGAPAITTPTLRANERYGVAVAVSDKVALTAASAVDGCRALRASGRPARLRLKDDASGLALLDLDGGGVAGAGLRETPLEAREALMLVGFGEEAGKRAAMALPGQALKSAGGMAVFAPLQPGQGGSPVFDRQGRLAGLVTANPSDRMLIAGVAPQRSHAVADGTAVQAVLAKAGLSLPAAAQGPDLSTGAIVEKVGKLVLPIICSL